MLAAEDYPGMRGDVFASRSWLLPLNVSVLTSLTPCEPPLLREPEGAGAGPPLGGTRGEGRGGHR